MADDPLDDKKCVQYVVSAPPGYANAEWNGERVIVLHTFEDRKTTLIVSGPHAGKRWQFLSVHLLRAA